MARPAVVNEDEAADGEEREAREERGAAGDGDSSSPVVYREGVWGI